MGERDVRDRVKKGGKRKQGGKLGRCLGREKAIQRERKHDGGWRAPSIKQVFEKGRQREKVSAKYLKEC